MREEAQTLESFGEAVGTRRGDGTLACSLCRGTRRIGGIILAFFLGLALGQSVALAAPGPFEDVPPASWPYAVVDYFARRGWVRAPAGDLYVSGRSLTRYELALMTTNIVDRVGGHAAWRMTDQELHWLGLLVKEYTEELALLGYRLESVTPRTFTPTDLVPAVGGGVAGEGRTAKDGAAFENGVALLRLQPWPADPLRGLTGRTGMKAMLAHRTGSGSSSPRRGELRSDGWEALRLASLRQPSAERIISPRRQAAQLQGPAGRGWGPLSSPGEWALVARGGEGVRADDGRGLLVGARATFSVVERSAAEWVKPGFPSPDRWDEGARDLRSYDLVLDLGDVRVTAPRTGSLRRGLDAWQERRAIGPVEVNSDWASVVPNIQTGNWALYEEVKDLKTTTASRAGVGMDFFIPSARLRLGWRYESEFDQRLAWGSGTTVAGMEYQIDSRAQALAGIVLSDEEEGTTRTTQLGLRYSLGRDASLLLGYRLIDFTDLRDENRDDVLTKMATAEFSTRF